MAPSAVSFATEMDRKRHRRESKDAISHGRKSPDVSSDVMNREATHCGQYCSNYTRKFVEKMEDRESLFVSYNENHKD
jgi:hypothetical protein